MELIKLAGSQELLQSFHTLCNYLVKFAFHRHEFMYVAFIKMVLMYEALVKLHLITNRHSISSRLNARIFHHNVVVNDIWLEN